VPIAEGAIKSADIHGNLGQVILGTRPSRTDGEQITLFNSVGLALQDMAAAHHVVDAAITARVGTEVAPI